MFIFIIVIVSLFVLGVVVGLTTFVGRKKKQMLNSFYHQYQLNKLSDARFSGKFKVIDIENIGKHPEEELLC